MSKTRVYELAKELGLENKAVLDLCKQLGFDDKASHSNSLSDDEAERIRRFVIRRAVNEKGPSVREVLREGSTVTESRMGGVIRRRKKTEEEEAAEAEARAAKQIDLSPLSLPTQDLPTLAPNPEADRLSRQAALREADALFETKPQSKTVVHEDSLAADHSDGSQNGTAMRSDSRRGDAVGHAVDEQEEDQSRDGKSSDAEDARTHGQSVGGLEVAAADDESSDEGAIDEADSLLAADENLGVGEQTVSDPNVAGVVSADEAMLADARKRHDIRAPRILGKIELPTKPVPRKPVARPAEATTASDPAAVEAEANRAGKPKKKGKVAEKQEVIDDRLGKRVKKKQILRKDELIDYEGERDGWRGKKTSKKSKSKNTDAAGNEVGPTKLSKKVVKVSGTISVGELAHQMSVKVGEVIGLLMKLGVMAGINQLIDFDTATIVAQEMGFTTTNTDTDVEDVIAGLEEVDSTESLILRPPVVTVMGHVDHGKTSLLDCIRRTAVTKSEFGGITQHIGAYNVPASSGGSVTFLDTPGHEAFTAMRSRGAKVTDIVVLVVAADDGVMPQTIEAINHAKAAGVPIIVAVNKIDKEGANRDRVVNQLSEHGLIPEEWGGQTIFCNVSAVTKEGIDSLLENLHLQAEILELKANPARRAKGTVIESKIDRGRGPVMTVLVQTGTLKKGDVFVAGATFGRVRALVADDGGRADEAGPSIPVEVLGASSPPLSGDDFIVFENEVQARNVASQRQQARRLKELAEAEKGPSRAGGLTLERFSEMVTTTADVKELPLIVKADVQGSVEAVTASLQQLSNSEIKVRVIHKGVGAISENDAQLAAASNAILVGFNVRADARASQVIDGAGVQVLYSRVIYDLVDMVGAAVNGMKAPVFKERTLGRVEVRQTFKVPKLGVIAGSFVIDGTIPRGAQLRLLRDSRVIYEGKMASLRRFKDDVKEVQAGYECGIGIEGYSDIKDGDVIEAFKVEEVRPS